MDKETEAKIEDGRITIASPLDFHFQTSREESEVHLVDLRQYDGSGACWCENFRFRIEPKLKAGKLQAHEAGSQCKHIVKSRLILADRLIKASIRQFDDEKENPHEKENSTEEEDPT